MTVGTIEHKDLPDNLLHEPKGASTASANTVYVADGEGTGSFEKVPVAALDITVPTVADAANTSIDGTISVDVTGLLEVPLGRLQNILSHAEIPADVTLRLNQNTSQLAAIYTNQKTINNNVVTAISNLRSDINRVIAALKGEGLFDE